jgi:hypothetical protein
VELSGGPFSQTSARGRVGVILITHHSKSMLQRTPVKVKGEVVLMLN